MADSDKSLYSLRYNQITSNLEAFGGGTPQWTLVTLNNVDPTQVPVTRLINTIAPLLGGGNLTADRTLSIPQAASSVDGYLSGADWITFNGKLTSSLTSANIFVGNGSNVAVGVPVTGDITLSNSGVVTLATVNGNVGSFTNANITVDAKGRITAASSGSDTGITQLTGDVTAGPGNGSQAATLATVNGNVGSFTYASLTVNAKGLITAASSGTAPVTSVSGTASDISSTGGTTPVIDLINTAVTPGSYTNTNLTVDAKGRITAASSGTAGSGTVNSGTAGNFSYYATSTTAVSDSGISISAPTFSGQVTGNTFKSTAATNQFSFTNGGGGNQIRTMSITGTTTAGEVITFPDVGVSTTIAYLEAAQTFSGAKTFSSTLTMSGATIAMGSNKITGLANGTTATDAAAFGQIGGTGGTNAAGYIKGTVVQAVQVIDTTGSTSSGTAYTSTTTAASITPAATTHKIRITVTGTLIAVTLNTSNVYASIFRGSTDLENSGNGFVLMSGTPTTLQTPCSISYLDSPATTSSTTYTFKIKSDVAAKAQWNGNGSAIIILEEIAF